MQSAAIPRATCDRMDGICRRFVWGASGTSSKMSLFSLKSLCQPKNRGGMGLRKMRDMNDALLMKLVWGLINGSNSLWMDVFRAKYKLHFSTPPSNLSSRSGSNLWLGFKKKVWKSALLGMCPSGMISGLVRILP